MIMFISQQMVEIKHATKYVSVIFGTNVMIINHQPEAVVTYDYLLTHLIGLKVPTSIPPHVQTIGSSLISVCK